jgi:hypothetical protein
MNQQPDKLFREKLEGFTRPVSASAWNRVEAGLDKKNSKGLWLKIAAAVTIVAVATFVLWPTADPSTVNTISEKKPVDANKIKQQPKELKQQPKENSVITDKKATDPSPLAAHKSTIPDKKNKSRKEKTFEDQKPVIKEEQAPLIVLQKPEAETPPVETVVAQVVEENATTSTQPSTPQHFNTSTPDRVRIVYSAEEINDKYLDKKSLAEATSGEKKPSTLRKLIDKAYDLKNNEDPFGDLRQKKNEILALNFKNDKQERSENK